MRAREIERGGRGGGRVEGWREREEVGREPNDIIACGVRS